jgi:hypothetical protein
MYHICRSLAAIATYNNQINKCLSIKYLLINTAETYIAFFYCCNLIVQLILQKSKT